MAKSKKKGGQEPVRGKDYVRRLLLEAWHDEETEVDEVLWQLMEGAEDPGRDLAMLAAYDLDRSVWEPASALIVISQREASLAPRDSERLGTGARPVLLGALRDPDLPDDRKYMLGPLYMLCGGDLSREEIGSFFRDFEGAVERQVKEMMARVSDQPASTEQMLSSMEFLESALPGEAERPFAPLLAMGSELATGDPAAAAALLGAAAAIAIEQGEAEGGARQAIELVAEHPCPRAAFVLRELGAWPGAGALGTEARLAAERVALAGVEPRASVLSEFSHGILSSIDGAGSRATHLFFRTPEGGMDVVGLILNDAVGVKDVWFVAEDGAEVEAVLRESAVEMSLAPCPLPLAREVVADMWAMHEQLDKPLPGHLFVVRPYLGDAPLEPRRRKPNLGAYMLELVKRSPDLVDRSERLADEAIYGGLFFCSDAAYEHVDQVRPRRGRQRLSRKKLDTFIRDVAILERETLLARMAINLEVESLAGRATQPLNRIAARTWLALTEEVVPFHDVPYIYALADLSTQMIIENLKLGFRSQAAADQAALEMDEMDSFLDDEEDEQDDFFFGDDGF